MANGIDHGAVRTFVELAPMTTYKVGGPARWYAEPKDLEELRSVLAAAGEQIPVAVIGRGSNIVVSDDGFDGLVVRLGKQFSATSFAADGSVVAGAAAPLPKLAREAASRGRGGLSFYVGIPGSVGGAVRMNAGGHGTETADVLRDAVVLDIGSRELSIRSVSDLDLRYRYSNLSDGEIVVRATFVTSANDPDALTAELREITRWRKEHQPGGTLNAGSVFKNPETITAGELIDNLGLKGTSIGPVGVSTVHANFLVAERDAKAADIHRFIHSIKKTVEQRAGIVLEPEVRFIGTFEEVSNT